jgi:HPt (histidine-containing phosphotransfer) domain-containing protein
MTDKTDQINKTDTTDKADPTNTATDDIHALLADLWQRHLPTLHDRLNILDRTAKEATSGNLPEPTREEAQSIAHKLAGNLGMFGHSEAGDIASQMEQILKAPTAQTLSELSPLAQSLRQQLAPNL